MKVDKENVQVIILAAGEGNRLRPHTLDRPKCMVPLLDQTLLDHQLATLSSVGLNDIYIATGYRAEQLKQFNHPTRHNPIYDSSNMVETLMCAKDILRNGKHTVIAYADIVYNASALETLLNGEAPFATVVDADWLRLWELRGEDPLEDAESLEIKDGNITDIGKKVASVEEIQAQYIGLTYCDASLANDFVEEFYKLPDTGPVFDGRDRANMYMTSFLQHLIDIGWDLHAAIIESGWIEVDTTTDLALYEELAANGTLNKFVNIGRR